MKDCTSLYLVAAAAASLMFAACSQEGSPASDTLADSVTADSVSDAGQDIATPDNGSDSTTDAIEPDTPVQDAEQDGQADTSQPDVPTVSTVGTYIYDYAQTETTTLDRFLTVPSGRFRTVAVNDCGLVGFVFTDRYNDGQGKLNNSLIFSEVNLSSPPDMSTPPSRATLRNDAGTDSPVDYVASVAYDECVPMVFVQTAEGFEYARVGGGQITWTNVDPSGTYSEIKSFGAFGGRDGKVHLVFQARPAGKTMQFVDAAFNGTTFDVVQAPTPDTAMTSPIDVAIDGDGALVVGYLKAGTTATEAWVAHRNGAQWDKEQITGAVPSDFGLSFAIGSYGREGLAWTEIATTDDGLLISATLNYTYRDLDDTFVTETVLTANDGYLGGGGTWFTGGDPKLVIDWAGKPHIIFSDIAVFNDGKEQTIDIGQVRYAYRKRGTWHTETVYGQRPPDANGTPKVDFRGFAVNRAGSAVGISAVAIENTWSGDANISTIGASVATRP